MIEIASGVPPVSGRLKDFASQPGKTIVITLPSGAWKFSVFFSAAHRIVPSPLNVCPSTAALSVPALMGMPGPRFALQSTPGAPSEDSPAALSPAEVPAPEPVEPPVAFAPLSPPPRPPLGPPSGAGWSIGVVDAPHAMTTRAARTGRGQLFAMCARRLVDIESGLIARPATRETPGTGAPPEPKCSCMLKALPWERVPRP